MLCYAKYNTKFNLCNSHCTLHINILLLVALFLAHFIILLPVDNFSAELLVLFWYILWQNVFLSAFDRVSTKL
jgi:hypothetical protein